MRTRPLIRVALAALLAGCAGVGRAPVTVPEDAENPIMLRFRGATPPDAVDVITKACSDLAIGVLMADAEGYVETRWMDITALVTVGAEAYPLRERQVQYRFEVREAEGRARLLTIATYYQPNRPPGAQLRPSPRYDQLVPTDHPAYSVALELNTKIRVGLRGLGATLVD